MSFGSPHHVRHVRHGTSMGGWANGSSRGVICTLAAKHTRDSTAVSTAQSMNPRFFALPNRTNTLAVGVLCLTVSTGSAFAQSDDFNDGNDAGWSHYSPLSAFGAGAVYTFPTGGYRVAAPASPAPEQLGPQRAGSLRAGTVYTRARVEADIEGWNNEINQSLGVIARVGNLGLGTTTGYTYNYNTVSGFHQLNLVVNESPQRQVNESPFKVDHTQRYRLVFTLVGTQLLGQMFSTTNSTVPLHSVVGTDDTHSEGTTGVFAFALSAGGPIDARFDNYVAAVPPKVRATMLDADPAVGQQPELPIETVHVRLASLETTISQSSIQLEVDGQVAAFELLEELSYLRLIHTPAAPLDPAVAHTAKVTFADEDGTQTFSWPFGAPAAIAPASLLAATSLSEAFQPAAGAVLEAASRTFRVPVQGTQRFFQVSDVTAHRITAVALTGDNVVITFE